MRLIVVAITLAFIAGSASAQTVTWTGTAADANWASFQNWSTGSTPANGATLVFSGTTQTTSTNTLTSGSYNGLFFSNDGSAGNTGQFTLSGNAFTLNGPITTTAATTGTLLDSVANNIALASTTTVTTGLNHNLTLSGIISGGFGVTKEGAGLLTLSGANTFTGVTTVKSGTVVVTNASSLGTGAASVTLGGGTLETSISAATNFARAVTVTADSTVRLSRSVSGGAVTATFASLSIGRQALSTTVGGNWTANPSLTFSAVTLTDSGTFNTLTSGVYESVTTLTNVTQSGGTYGFTKTGSGILAIAGTGNYGGDVSLQGGILRSTANTALGSGAVNFDAAGAYLQFNATNLAAPTTTAAINVLQSGTIGFYRNSSGMTATTGTISVSAGRQLTFLTGRSNSSGGGNFNHALASPLATLGSGTFSFENGNQIGLIFTGTTTIGGALTINPIDTGTIAFNAPITDGDGAHGLTFIGAGPIRLNAANSYNGNTTISSTAGVLTLGNVQAIPSGTGNGNLSMGPASGTATLDLNGLSPTLNGLSSSGAGLSVIDNLAATAATLTIGGNDGGGTFAGQIRNTGGGAMLLVKTGAGLIKLSGSNDYSGGTHVNNGTLVYGSAASRPASGTTAVGSSATLGLGVGDAPGYFTSADVDALFSGTLAGVSMNEGAGVAIDTSAGDFTYATSQSSARGLTKLGAAALILSGSNTFAGGIAVNAGTLRGVGVSLTGGTVAPTTDPFGASTITLNSGTLQVRDDADGTVTPQTLTYDNPIVVNANATVGVDRIGGTATDKTVRFGRLTLAGGVTFTTTAGNSYAQFYDSSAATGTNTLLGNVTFDAGNATYLGHSGATNSATNVSLTDGGNNYTLTKSGAGTLVLGRTTVGGVITVNAGTLSLGSVGNGLPGGIVVNAGTLLANAANGVLGEGTSPDVKVNGGAVDLRNTTSAQTVGFDYAGNATLNLRNNGSTTFQVESLDIAAAAANFTLNVNRVSGVNTDRTHAFQGPITTAGPLQFNVTGANNFQAAINASSSVSLGGDITFNPTTTNLTIDAAITDGGSNHALTKIGGGVLILGGTNTFGGDTKPAVGELRLTNSGALRNSTVNLATGDTGTLSFAAVTSATFGGLKGTRDLVLTNTNSAAVTLSVGNNNQSTTYGGVLSGAGALIKIGAGTLTLGGVNSYSGGTTLSSGTLITGHAAAYGSGGVTIAPGATLDLGNFAIANAITNNGGTVINAGNYGGTQTVTSGTATLEGSIAGTVDVSANAVADFAGEIIPSGTIAVGGGGRGRASGRLRGRVNISTSGTFELVDGAAVDATAVIDNGGSLRVDRTQDLDIASAIIGSGGLRKAGSARLVLSGSNSYAGPTEVHEGQLAVNGRIAGGVTVASGASLGGSGVIAGSLTGDGLIGPGNSPGILTVEGSITPTASTGFAFELTQADPIWASGTASANDVLRLTNADPFTSNLQSSNIVQVFFEVANLTIGDEFRGGFFIDNPNQTAGLLEAELGNATFNYFVLGNGGGSNEYNGRSYYTFAEYLAANPGLGITEVVRSVVGVTSAGFESGAVTTGSVTQFAIVPEPHAWALAAAGLAFMAAWQRRRAR